MYKWMLCLIGFTVLAGSAVKAEEAKGAPEKAKQLAQFKRFDKDADGQVTQDEFSAMTLMQAAKNNKELLPEEVQKRFMNRDHNYDGVISREEFIAPPGAYKKVAFFKKVDTDKNGKISKEEFTAYTKKIFEKQQKPGFAEEADKRFKRRDKNKDGVLNMQEFILPAAKKKTPSK